MSEQKRMGSNDTTSPKFWDHDFDTVLKNPTKPVLREVVKNACIQANGKARKHLVSAPNLRPVHSQKEGELSVHGRTVSQSYNPHGKESVIGIGWYTDRRGNKIVRVVGSRMFKRANVWGVKHQMKGLDVFEKVRGNTDSTWDYPETDHCPAGEGRTCTKRDRLLTRLEKTKGFNHIADSTGYGVAGVLYFVSDSGIIWLGSLAGDEVVECPVMSKDEFSEIKRSIQENTVDEDELDWDPIRMVKGGCKPNIQYWRLSNELIGDLWDPEYYTSYDEAFDTVGDLVDGEFMPWEDMADEELEGWLKVVQKHEVEQADGDA